MKPTTTILALMFCFFSIATFAQDKQTIDTSEQKAIVLDRTKAKT